jgi:hypothetical protein
MLPYNDTESGNVQLDSRMSRSAWIYCKSRSSAEMYTASKEGEARRVRRRSSRGKAPYDQHAIPCSTVVDSQGTRIKIIGVGHSALGKKALDEAWQWLA